MIRKDIFGPEGNGITENCSLELMVNRTASYLPIGNCLMENRTMRLMVNPPAGYLPKENGLMENCSLELMVNYRNIAIPAFTIDPAH